MELDDSLSRVVSTINHYSGLSGISTGETIDVLVDRFGEPSFRQTSINGNETMLGWVTDSANRKQATLSASIMVSDRTDGVHDPLVITRLILE